MKTTGTRNESRAQYTSRTPVSLRGNSAIPGTPYLLRDSDERLWYPQATGRLALAVGPRVPHPATQRCNRRQVAFFGDDDYGTDLGIPYFILDPKRTLGMVSSDIGRVESSAKACQAARTAHSFRMLLTIRTEPDIASHHTALWLNPDIGMAPHFTDRASVRL